MKKIIRLQISTAICLPKYGIWSDKFLTYRIIHKI